MADCTCGATFGMEHGPGCPRYPEGGYPPLSLPDLVGITPQQAVQVARQHLANSKGLIGADIVAGVIADADLADERSRDMAKLGMEVAAELTVAEAEMKRIRADRDRLAAVIEQVRALHRPDNNEPIWCAECSAGHPCATAALLPPDTQPTQEA